MTLHLMRGASASGRKLGDKRRDDVVKAEMLNEHVIDKGRYLWVHFDDRSRCVDMFRARGVNTFQAASGDF